MVMGQFVTTYRKDYLWPYVKTLGLKPEPEHLYRPQYRDPNACTCHCLPQPMPTSEQIGILGPQAYENEAWSRVGPMGPLLDPKLYPAKFSAAPESKVSRYSQPNVFLKKLEEKYPFIYECLRVAPPGDMLSRINKDRLSTTYQVDYCKKMEYPSAPYDELIRAAGVEGLAPCPESVRLPGDVCRPLQKDNISKRVGGGNPCRRIPRMEEAKACGRTCSMKSRKRPYTCPKAPPGPYYRPYEIQNNLSIEKAYNTEGKSCKPPNLVGQMAGWNPFVEENPVENDCLNKWGQMIHRNTLHVHGGFSPPKPKRH